MIFILKILKKLPLLFLLFIVSVEGAYAAGGTKKWSAQEDRVLLDAVNQIGKKWSEIAKLLKGRTPRRCRERYEYHLSPSPYKRTPWTADEDAMLLSLHDRYGSKWSVISDAIKSRSPNAVKNRFRCLTKNKNKLSGGFYKDVRRRPGYQIHHLPSRAAWGESGLKIENGLMPCIELPTEVHGKTKSFGSTKESKEFREDEVRALKTGDKDKILAVMVRGIPTPERKAVVASSPFRHAVFALGSLEAVENKTGGVEEFRLSCL